ncbi:MAG: ABC transporter permease [Thermodesulfobacteriota bacterium]
MTRPLHPDSRPPQPWKLAFLGAALLFLVVAGGLLAPILAPHDPFRVSLPDRLKPPGPAYYLGTDNLGRCLLSRLLYGVRLSLTAGLAASGLSVAIGLAVGLLAGLAGKVVDAALMELTNLALAFPGLMLALVLAGVLGPSLATLVLGLSGLNWAWWARFVRGLVLSAKEKEYVLGAVALGVKSGRLARRYILPQVAPQLLVVAALKTGWTIAAISGLGYLGLGAQPPAPEWGAMLQESRLFLARAPWLIVGPGAFLTVTVLGFNLLAEGLRDRFQVRPFLRW